jgi:hypothetical protein
MIVKRVKKGLYHCELNSSLVTFQGRETGLLHKKLQFARVWNPESLNIFKVKVDY